MSRQQSQILVGLSYLQLMTANVLSHSGSLVGEHVIDLAKSGAGEPRCSKTQRKLPKVPDNFLATPSLNCQTTYCQFV